MHRYTTLKDTDIHAPGWIQPAKPVSDRLQTHAFDRTNIWNYKPEFK